MVRMEDDCVACDVWCMGAACKYFYPNPHFYCDECGKEVDELWKYDNSELCYDCLCEALKADGIDIEDSGFDPRDYAERVEESEVVA